MNSSIATTDSIGSLNRNLRAIGLYALGTLLISGSNFAATPLLIHLLGTGGFSRWAAIEPLILLIIPLAGLGIQHGLLNQLPRDGSAAQRLLPWHVLSALGMAALLALGMTVSGWPIRLGLLAAGIAAIEGMIVFQIAWWRATGRPGAYAIREGGRAVLIALALAAIALLAGPSLSLDGYLILRLALGATFLLPALLAVNWPWSPDPAKAGKAIAYGLPIVLASAIVVALMNFDRYAVLAIASNADLTAYVAHARLAQILGPALAPFFFWLAPLAVARLHAKTADTGFFGASFFGFASADLALTLALWLLAPALWPILFPGIAFDPLLFGLFLAGMAVFACGNPLSLGSLREGRTTTALVVTGFAALAGLCAIALLAPRWGVHGIAAGKTVGLCAYALGFALHTRRTLSIAYPWPAIAIVTGLTVILAVALYPLAARLAFPAASALAATAAAFVLLAAWSIWRLRPDFAGKTGSAPP